MRDGIVNELECERTAWMIQTRARAPVHVSVITHVVVATYRDRVMGFDKPVDCSSEEEPKRTRKTK